MSDSSAASLCRGHSDRRVRVLRERLVRAGQLPQDTDLDGPQAT